MATVLAAGVYLSGFVKDLLCLPRPLSPPLTRITMSGSAALEYGFPSTHSTNAVSVAVFSLLLLRDENNIMSPTTTWYLQCLAYFYACSIVLGRLYCGMHGFFDVIWGGILGAAIAFAQYYLAPIKDEWLFSGPVQNPAISTLVTLVLVRLHPEPADNCPCFDDSVAFAGVVIGCDIGGWHFARSKYTDLSAPYPSTVPFDLHELGWLKFACRIVLGVIVVFIWRAVMKPTLLSILPPIFRVVENFGLDLPRRFFKPASQYSKVPDQKDDDNVIPSARDIPHLLKTFRQRRAVSVGPQSEADAYEALAYRKKRRRDSLKSLEVSTAVGKEDKDYFEGESNTASQSRKRSLSLQEFRAQMGASSNLLSPNVIASTPHQPNGTTSLTHDAEEEKDKTELFAGLQKPRVRYDVEVVTKLIVYTGIAWWAVEGNPILFHYLGLST